MKNWFSMCIGFLDIDQKKREIAQVKENLMIIVDIRDELRVHGIAYVWMYVFHVLRRGCMRKRP